MNRGEVLKRLSAQTFTYPLERMAVTLKQISKAAGVTAATVSRALNGKPGVGPRMRARIERIAGDLGYTPDAQAQALVTGRVSFLGLVVSDITNPYYPALARSVEEAAGDAGYSVLLMNTNWRTDRLHQAVDLLLTRRVAGLIMAVPVERADAAAAIPWDRIRGPVVLVGRTLEMGLDLPAVSVDHHLGGRLVGNHLRRLGHRNVAFIGGAAGDVPSRMRLAGLGQGLGEDLQMTVSHGEWTVESGERQLGEILASGRRPDAVFAANDLIAIGAHRALRGAGLVPGHDVGLVGYDDIPSARYMDPPLTTVAQPTEAMGRLAVTTLLADLGEATPEPLHALEPRLIVRGSCGAKRRHVHLVDA